MMKMREENDKLRETGNDLLLLIEEHGSSIMKAHATRILKDRVALEGK